MNDSMTTKIVAEADMLNAAACSRKALMQRLVSERANKIAMRHVDTISDRRLLDMGSVVTAARNGAMPFAMAWRVLGHMEKWVARDAGARA